MGYNKKIWVLILLAGSLSFCASKQENKIDFPQEIAAAYFQKINTGDSQARAGNDFYIEFDKPLKKGMALDKVYFRNQVAILEKENDSVFVAHFYEAPTNQDIILDSNPLKEYGNAAPVIVKPKFDLKPNEAILQYKKKNKTAYYKITSVKEKPIILYPSGIKPKN
ncbi:hypothetical protein [Flavobacterium frigoris]|uniref:Lipoprotein n=1 Tax=Flavobacterium frigoris TaxID=229204 RepID=A0A1H9CSJ1_FLAFI|nr:hypothetical protein [Flavobacterium frigoris]SEQ04134.1 hypothetical protein SAMN05444355_101258 [Flavobacterium frigoris]